MVPLPVPPPQVLCRWSLARRVDTLLAAASKQPSVLTAALRSVIARAPADLDWVQLQFVDDDQSYASFRAEGSDGHLYSINCLDGTVLEDGAPPGRVRAWQGCKGGRGRGREAGKQGQGAALPQA